MEGGPAGEEDGSGSRWGGGRVDSPVVRTIQNLAWRLLPQWLRRIKGR
jgi:hypothetical protein